MIDRFTCMCRRTSDHELEMLLRNNAICINVELLPVLHLSRALKNY